MAFCENKPWCTPQVHEAARHAESRERIREEFEWRFCFPNLSIRRRYNPDSSLDLFVKADTCVEKVTIRRAKRNFDSLIKGKSTSTSITMSEAMNAKTVLIFKEFLGYF